ncbi:hypothetical protein [Kitasatospora sp. GP82]|uniref:hypothetical protein n=1 Tax=Kitasatospora sp. GP82 TaxID=3035089 RepID=UPI0024765C1F|nr:hypothetical protein [Kitasatospora sp. GP82]MDH6126062.1 hypothetical protein [Kitasatospora sp. GP82]
MKLKGARLITVELLCAALVAGGIAWIAASGETPKKPDPAASASAWAEQFEAKQKRSIVAGRFAQSLIVARGQERSQELCAVEWAKLGPERQADLDENAFGAGCAFQP